MYDIFFISVYSVSQLYLLPVWGMTKQGYIIHYRASTSFFFFFFFRKYIYHCQGQKFMHAVDTKWKKNWFSLNSSILLFKHYILYYLLCLFHYTKIQVHLLILSINVKWMNNQLFHLMAWSDFRWSISVAINITMMLSWQIIPKKPQNKPICLYSPKLCSKPQEQNSTFTSVILYDIQWR